MTEGGFRTGAPRDVPPPRPVPGPATDDRLDDGPAARAARAVADAVGGLVGGDGGRSAAAGLRDVLGAVAGAVGGAFAPGRDGDTPASGGNAAASSTGGDRSPRALLGDLLAAAAPRLPIRDADRLRQAYPGMSDDEALVARAARLTGGIGAATGGLSAAHWFSPASLLALPLELGAETVLLGAVEVVLVGELHELHGRRAPGDARARAAAYLASWSAQRPVEGAGAAGLSSLLGVAGMQGLRRLIPRKVAGTASSTAPLMIGAAVSRRLNRRATESLAARVLDDLRAGRSPG
jgi:hypothetical protein